jgi:hypothetical protein
MDADVRAHHEAGHAVAASVLGTPIKRASLDEVWTLVRVGCPRAQRNQAIIALAGAEAETKYCGHSLDRQAELWGVAWATDLAAVGDLERAAIAPALCQARQLVDQHWRAIEAVAQALLERGELTGADIHALIGLADPETGH